MAGLDSQKITKKPQAHKMFAVDVENIGFEPITSSLPAKRSSQMS